MKKTHRLYFQTFTSHAGTDTIQVRGGDPLGATHNKIGGGKMKWTNAEYKLICEDAIAILNKRLPLLSRKTAVRLKSSGGLLRKLQDLLKIS